MLLLAPPVALLNGCGGGGGGGSTGSPTPIAPTPTVGPRVLVVQLRDSAGNAVDGVVSIGANPVAGTSILATSGGSVTFNRNVAAGTTPVKAEVEGNGTNGSILVKTAGTTIYTLLVTAQITPAPSATLPPPPFPP